MHSFSDSGASVSSVFTLNPRQHEAVKYIDGPLLVLAGAGSGKTRVITEKIAYLLKVCEIPAKNIAAVTFTNKAAREMKTRVSKSIGGDVSKGLVVSTFHNLGLRIIRSEIKHLGLKNGFSIFDAYDSKNLINDLMIKAKFDDSADAVLTQISKWKNNLIDPDTAMRTAENDIQQRDAILYKEYIRHLRSYNAVDFDDLISLPTLLLKNNAEVREKWQNKIRYLLVDEYQDTNASQYLLVKLLVGVRAALTVVGDDDQSIYAWRGAQPENLALLSNDFPKLKVVKLEQNYRSTRMILDAANAVIANNAHVFEKKLWSELGFGDPIKIIACKNEIHEVERIVSELLNNKIMSGAAFRDFAILYRGNHQSKLLEMRLQELQIPYKISGGTSFFAKSEIRDLMSYFRLLINPEDDAAFLRIINTPRREIGPATLEKLSDYASERNIALLAACQEVGLKEHLQGALWKRLDIFADWFNEKQKVIDEKPVGTLRQILVDIDYDSWIKEQSSSSKAAEYRMENVNFLISNIEKMLQKDEEADFRSVIAKLVLFDLLEQQDQEDKSDGVQLSTLHASKGLEFPHVFLMGVEEGFLPHHNSIDEDNIEEERRLMYVGITRAQQTLQITYTKQRTQYGDKVEIKPSRFLDEMPDACVLWKDRNPGEQKTPEEKKALGNAHLDAMRAMLNKPVPSTVEGSTKTT